MMQLWSTKIFGQIIKEAIKTAIPCSITRQLFICHVIHNKCKADVFLFEYVTRYKISEPTTSFIIF